RDVAALPGQDLLHVEFRAAILATPHASQGAANCRSRLGSASCNHYNLRSHWSTDVIARPNARLFPRGRLAVLLHIRVLVLALVTLTAAIGWMSGQFHVPPLAAGIVLALAIATLALWLRARLDDEGAPPEAFLHLCIDVFLVVIWLTLTDATANPFVFLLIVPVALAAAMLPPGFAAATMLLSVAGYTALLFLPSAANPVLALHAIHDETLAAQSVSASNGQDFAQHRWGMWIAFIVTAIFVGTSVYSHALHLHR